MDLEGEREGSKKEGVLERRARSVSSFRSSGRKEGIHLKKSANQVF